MIRAPCCNEIFPCRHCHNETTTDKHQCSRHDVQSVVCLICDTEQKVAQICANCGVNMGEYFCEVCKFYDDNIEKGQYHCFDCGICRVGGKDNYFHCLKCGSCYRNTLFGNHVCVENSMKSHCPICYEYLFDSLREVNVLKCGHTMHSECLTQMEKHKRYTCPICLKLIFDMNRVEKQTRQKFDTINISENQQSTISKKGWILCNDCNDTMEAYLDILGHKTCCYCYSYNTTVIVPPALPQ